MKKPTAERLKEARESRVEAENQYNGVADLLGTDAWKEDEHRPLLDKHKRSYDAALQLVDDLTDQLAVQSRSGSDGEPIQAPAIIDKDNIGDKIEQKRRQFRLGAAIESVVEQRNFTGVEAEMLGEGKKEFESLGKRDLKGEIQLPSWLIGTGRSSIAEQDAIARYGSKRGIEQRDVLAETAGSGGYLVATDLGGLIPVLEPRLQVEGLGATVLRNLTGNLDLARAITYGTATWEGEVDDAAETQPTFDVVQLRPERLAAFTQVSRQSLRQSRIIDVENYIRRDLNGSVARALETAALNGSGSGDQPTGILNTGSINDITIGTDGGPLDWALLVAFETALASDNADDGMMAWLTTPGVAGYLKTIKRDIAGNDFAWRGNNQNGTINDYKARVTTLMPSTLSKGSSGSILHAAIFANWRELIIAMWGGLDLIVDPYTQKNKGMVELTVNSYWDIALMHLESFCMCNEIDIS